MQKLSKIKTLKGDKDYNIKVKEYENERDRLWNVVEEFSKYIHDYENKETKKILALNLKKKETMKLHEELSSKLGDMLQELDENKDYQKALKEYNQFVNENSDLGDSTYYNIEEHEKKINEYDFNDFYDEYNNLKNIYMEVLKLEEEICIYPFWQDEEAIDIESRRQVTIENLDIDDLLFLPYNNLLIIKRK